MGNGTETSLICSYLTAPELEETFGEDSNTYTMTGMRCCDIQISEQSILKGAKYSYAIADENKKTFEVDYIVQSDTLILDAEGANKCQINKSSAGNIFKNYYDLLMDGLALS